MTLHGRGRGVTRHNHDWLRTLVQTKTKASKWCGFQTYGVDDVLFFKKGCFVHFHRTFGVLDIKKVRSIIQNTIFSDFRVSFSAPQQLKYTI